VSKSAEQPTVENGQGRKNTKYFSVCEAVYTLCDPIQVKAENSAALAKKFKKSQLLSSSGQGLSTPYRVKARMPTVWKPEKNENISNYFQICETTHKLCAPISVKAQIF